MSLQGITDGFPAVTADYAEWTKYLSTKLAQDPNADILSNLSIEILRVKENPYIFAKTVAWWLCDYALEHRKTYIIDELFLRYGKELTVDDLRAEETEGIKKDQNLLFYMTTRLVEIKHPGPIINALNNAGKNLTSFELTHVPPRLKHINVNLLFLIARATYYAQNTSELEILNAFWEHLTQLPFLKANDFLFKSQIADCKNLSILWMLAFCAAGGNDIPLKLVWQKWYKEIPFDALRVCPKEGIHKSKTIIWLSGFMLSQNKSWFFCALYQRWQHMFRPPDLNLTIDGCKVIEFLIQNAVKSDSTNIKELIERIFHEMPALIYSQRLSKIANLLETNSWGKALKNTIEDKISFYDSFSLVLNLLVHHMIGYEIMPRERDILQKIYSALILGYSDKADELYYHSLYVCHKILRELRKRENKVFTQIDIFDACLGAICLSAKSVLAHRRSFSLGFLNDIVFSVVQNPYHNLSYRHQHKRYLIEREAFYLELLQFDCGSLIGEQEGLETVTELSKQIRIAWSLKLIPPGVNDNEKACIDNIMRLIPLLSGMTHAVDEVREDIQILNTEETSAADEVREDIQILNTEEISAAAANEVREDIEALNTEEISAAAANEVREDIQALNTEETREKAPTYLPLQKGLRSSIKSSASSAHSEKKSIRFMFR